MTPYGVQLTTLTERPAREGGTMLTGRLGDAVIVALPIPSVGDEPRRWRVTLVRPTNSTPGRIARRAREAAIGPLDHHASGTNGGAGGPKC